MRNETGCRWAVPVAALAAVGLIWTACGASKNDTSHGHGNEQEKGHGAGEHAGHGCEHDNESPGSAHGHGASSDLDRPVADLFLEQCEHGIRTFECDECRYEVGVVRVPRALVDDGLVTLAVVAPRQVEATLSLPGEVRFDDRAVTHLGTQVDGVLRSIHVQPGQSVAKGDLLFEIESAELGASRGEYLEARALVAPARRNRDRTLDLRRDGIASEREILQASQDLEIAEIRVRAAADKLVRLGMVPGEIASMKTGGRGQVEVRAPRDGTVVERKTVAGESVRAGESVVVLADLARLRVFGNLRESDMLRLGIAAEGLEPAASISVRALPGKQFEGRIETIGPSVDPATRTLPVRVAVANPDGLLRPGMFATVSLRLGAGQTLPSVPRGAILQDEGRSFVFVHHDGDFYVRRPVETGPEMAGFVGLSAGLSGGETVVSDGSFLLKSDVLRSKMGAGCAD